ncbi:uncharacterized protein LOC131160992 [Malania oleifera]|uniref:uncharacterized protein LOC131160992 n=1 Tax=Malania oleifera TaxID=397392 RepID=UPI0025AE3C42|nr:uncharacterized protein LOC131160992 [Malania oleifera]
MVRRILIDNRSSANIMFWSVLVGMKIGKERLKPVSTPLVGFGGDTVHPLGTITLPVTIGTTLQQVTTLIEFLVVDRPSVYNVILGRPFLNAVRVVTSTYYLKVKFPTPQGIGYAKGDQAAARSCYVMALKRKMKAKEALKVEDLEVRGEYPQINTLHEDINHIPLRGHQERSIQIGNHLPDTLKAELTELLDKFSDLFAWSAEDMPGINPTMIEHRLQANFIREVDYPEWLSNVVLVRKPNGKWRTCIDFTDLNKACPKDSFPLPRIDQLVDSTSEHELLSFMDAYLGYNQIPMSPADEEKTSFVTERGLYCYRVMPFGLKNSGATYQRLVNNIFKEQLGRTMEAYVDDMLVKSMEAEQHCKDLRETFELPPPVPHEVESPRSACSAFLQYTGGRNARKLAVTVSRAGSSSDEGARPLPAEPLTDLRPRLQVHSSGAYFSRASRCLAINAPQLSPPARLEHIVARGEEYKVWKVRKTSA